MSNEGENTTSEQFVVEKPGKLAIKWFPPLTLVTLITLSCMSMYELTKQLIFPDITIWESHIVTIMFASSVATAAAYFVLHRYKLMNKVLQVERKALQESEEKYRMAMEATEDGLWDWNVQTGHTYYSPGWGRILGHDPSDIVVEYESWESRIHPKDRATTLQALHAHMEGQLPFFRAEHRLRTREGEWKCVLGRGRVVERDVDGSALRVAGTMSDITERVRAEKALRRYADEQAALYAVAAAAGASLDPDALLSTVLDIVLPIVNSDAGWVTLPGPSLDDPPRIPAWRGFPESFLGTAMTRPLRDCPAIASFLAGEETWAEGRLCTGCSRLPAKTLAGANLHSHACIPLTAGDQVLGLLNVGWHAPYPYTESERALLITIGRQVGMALHNAQLYQAARQVDQLRVLNDLDRALAATLDPDEVIEITLQRITAAVDAPMGALFATLLQKEGAPSQTEGVPEPEFRRVFTLNSGWIEFSSSRIDAQRSQAFRRRYLGSGDPIPLSGEELAAIAGSQGQGLTGLWGEHSVILPVQHDGTLIAVLALGGRPDERPFTEEDLMLAQTAIARAAQSIQSAQRHQVARKAEARYRDLYHNVPVGLYRTTPEGRFLSASRALVQMLGYPDEESLLTVNATDLHVDTGDRRRWQALVEREGGARGFEVQLVRYDGSSLWVESNAHAVRDESGQAVYYEGSLVDVTARVQAEKKVQQWTSQLEALREIGLKIAAQLDLDALLYSVASRAIELVGGIDGGLYLYRPDRDVLEWAVSIGDHAPIGTVLHRGEGLGGKVWETGETLVVNDYQRWEGRAAVYEGYPYMSVIGLPVRWGEEFLGVLDVNGDATRVFSSTDAELLGLFATQAAIAIRNARLYEQAQQEITARRQAEEELNQHREHLEELVEARTVELAKANEALRESEERYRSTIDGMSDWIHVVDRDLKLVLFNKEVRNTVTELGIGEGLAGKELLELFPFLPPQTRGEYEQVLETGERLLIEETIEIGQRQMWAETRKIPILDHERSVHRIITIIRDVTERKRAEEALRESESKLDGILSAMDDYVFTFDTEGRFTFAHTPTNGALYVPLAAFIGKKTRDVMPPDVDALSVDALEKTKIGQVAEFDYRLDMGTGDEWFSAKLSPMFVADEFAGAVAVVRNITARVQAQEALRESENRFRQIFDLSPQPVAITDLSGRLVNVNRELCRVSGYAPEELIGHTVTQVGFYSPEKRAKFVQELRSSGAVNGLEMEFHLKDGSTVSELMYASFIQLGNEQFILTMLVDITERKQAEKALREANLVVENSPAVLFRWRAAEGWPVELVSENVSQFGYTHEQLLASGTRYISIIYPDDRERVAREVQEFSASGVDRFQQEYRIVTKDGDVRWVDDHTTIQRDAHGNITHYQGIVLDITERVRAEQEIKQLHEQTQRDAETKATLLKEVNHRVRNNLAALIGILELEQERAAVDPSTYHAVMGDLTHRIRGLGTVHHMLSATEWSPPLLSELAEHVIGSALQALPRDKRVSVEVSPSALRVSPKHANNLALVFNELTTNSIKYAWTDRQSGRITVRIDRQEDMIVIVFQDDGKGYPKDVLTLERHSVGWELIQTIICYGMKGEVSLRNDQGAVTVLCYPAPVETS